MLEVRMLGQFDVRRDGAPIAIASRPAQSLLAYLLLNAGVEHRREKLAGLFWPDATEKNARSNLRHALWQLRDALESKQPRSRTAPFILVDDISISFNSASKYWLDAAIVQAASATIASADELIDALDRYRGELLPGFYDDWAVLERERLRAVFEQRMAQLLERLMEEQRWTLVIENAERWIALGQTPEAGYRALMIAYSHLGDRAKMAASWERLVAALATDLGVEPAEQTRQLYEQLKTGTPADLPAKTPQTSPAPTRTPSTNIPIPLTSFVGRESEIAEMTRLLTTTRMLSLIGPGGIGKTRLAMELGARLLDRYADGVWVITLAPLTEPSLFLQTVAAGLGLRDQGSRPIEEVLLEHLRQKHLLLILDNCEHMVDACAQSAAAWLAASQHLKIIVTSRQALNMGGELTWLVPGLSLPEATPARVDSSRSEAVQLFIERAKFALPSLQVTDATMETVVAICRRLDGLALAIELAASRVDTLSLEEIQRGVDHSLQLLTEGNRVASPRHQTLRACLDWSWSLLSEDERTLFRRLAVFAGAWTLEDAEQVCADQDLARERILQLLSALVRKSMVTVQARVGESNYWVLETIRLYALERLNETGEAARLSTRHRDWFLQLAEGYWAERSERRQAKRLITRLSFEHDNLRAALEWCQRDPSGPGRGLRLSGALGPHWEEQNALREGRDWIEKFLGLAQDSSDVIVIARAQCATGRLAYLQGEHDRAIAYFERGLELKPSDPSLVAKLHSNLGEAFYRRLDFPSATTHLIRAIELGSTIQDTVGVAYARMNLGNVYYESGELERAVTSYHQSLDAFRLTGQESNLASVRANLARLHQDRGEYQEAIDGYLEAIKLYEFRNDRYRLCIVYDNLSVVYMDLGEYATALEYLAKDIQIATSMENDFRSAAAFGNLAECQLALGDVETAHVTVTKALALVKKVQAPQHEGNIYRIRGQVFAALGRTAEAQADFETACRVLEPLKQRVRLARLYRAFGKFLMGQASTRDKGIGYVEQAQALFSAIGSQKEVEKIDLLLREKNVMGSKISSYQGG